MLAWHERMDEDDAPHAVPVEERDPRWDIAGFDEAFAKLDIAWVKVGYLRQLWVEQAVITRRRETPADAYHIGAPPQTVQLYCFDYRWASKLHADPERTRLKLLVEALDNDAAFDDDLVLWDWASIWLLNDEDKDAALHTAQSEAWVWFANTHFRIKTVCLPDAPLTEERKGGYYDSMWCLHGFSMSAFTQRIVNSSRPAVSSHMTPEWLLQTEEKLAGAFCVREADRSIVSEVRAKLKRRMLPARTDAVGFRTVCKVANFRWVLVSFVHALAERGGPAPRRQEMPPGTYTDGAVPPGRTPWVVSYGWASVEHFSPSGAKMCELSAALRERGAADDDVVFLDHMSLWQRGRTLPQAYAVANGAVERMVDYRYGRVTQGDMTKTQEKEMRFALYESTRLYAFAGGVLPTGERVRGCRVLVLPNVEPPESFPEHGELVLRTNTFCHPPRRELESAWGFCKSLSYHEGGWTCAEYSVARKNGTIANADDPEVARVEAARAWPDDVTAYAEMMDEESDAPVAFTKRGDREAVRFNFFKYVYAFGQTEL